MWVNLYFFHFISDHAFFKRKVYDLSRNEFLCGIIYWVNKASGGDGIPIELFKILKDDAVKVMHSICLQVWKTQQWPQSWKRSIFIQIPKKGNAKEC